MARFPYREDEIAALARSLVGGLTNQAAAFPAPPVGPSALAATLDAFMTAKSAVDAAESAYDEAVKAKVAALAALKEDLRSDLRYAEFTARGDAAKLKGLGWGARDSRTRLAVPGQPRLLVMTEQGTNRVVLRWKKPTDGGAVSAYAVERRVLPEGVWESVGLAVLPSATLENQPRGRELEYRVSAANKAGTGPPGDTVRAVL